MLLFSSFSMRAICLLSHRFDLQRVLSDGFDSLELKGLNEVGVRIFAGLVVAHAVDSDENFVISILDCSPNEL